jgi:hypothetical protein
MWCFQHWQSQWHTFSTGCSTGENAVRGCKQPPYGFVGADFIRMAGPIASKKYRPVPLFPSFSFFPQIQGKNKVCEILVEIRLN